VLNVISFNSKVNPHIYRSAHEIKLISEKEMMASKTVNQSINKKNSEANKNVMNFLKNNIIENLREKQEAEKNIKSQKQRKESVLLLASAHVHADSNAKCHE